MVTIKDGCGCGTASCCSWKDKLEEAYKRATASVNKIGDDAGSIYYPDGTGYVKLPLPTRAQVAQIQTNADDIATLKQRATASEGDINTLEQDVVRIDAKDTAQDQNIKDNSDRITSTNNDLIATEATVATHDSDIIMLKANNESLAKSLVSDVLMTDGTTAGSVQVSIERVDGALITSANYKWGRDIGVRLEAGTQPGYLKTVIDLSDGTTITSNEYKIVEVLESDVYVTAITLVPDMTAGTIGGNISYSNGTTQTINAVNVPTAPGVTSAIEALQGRMTAVENTNNTQASEITALNNRVQAIEDTPGVGQFGAGKLGTIAGSAADGRVAAENDGTGSVNGWSALKDRVTAAEGQIVTAQGDISNLDGLVAGKVDIMQGTGNAGKALIVGADGNVAPGEISGGEVWEEVDLSNFPTDWVAGDRVKIRSNTKFGGTSPNSWTSPITDVGEIKDHPTSPIAEFILNNSTINEGDVVIHTNNSEGSITLTYLGIGSPVDFNSRTSPFVNLTAVRFNGTGRKSKYIGVTRLNLSTYVKQMWRLKK